MQHATCNNDEGTADGLVTPAAYAKLRGLARSTVSRQIREGKIPTRNAGMVNPAEAERARSLNLDARRRQQAKARKQRRAMGTSTGSGSSPKSPIPTAAADPEIEETSHTVAVEILRIVAAPSEVLQMARVALALGCSREQAYAAGLWHACQAALAVDKVTCDDLAGFEEPKPEQGT